MCQSTAYDFHMPPNATYLQVGVYLSLSASALIFSMTWSVLVQIVNRWTTTLAISPRRQLSVFRFKFVSSFTLFLIFPFLLFPFSLLPFSSSLLGFKIGKKEIHPIYHQVTHNLFISPNPISRGFKIGNYNYKLSIIK